MREILFRGKRVDNKEWVYGSLISYPNNVYEILKLEMGRCCLSTEHFKVIPETICQYTGLEDNNGKKIFEGDIVYEGCNGFEAPVVYDKKLGTYRLDGLGEDYIIKDAPIEWEVIGNVFDEKE